MAKPHTMFKTKHILLAGALATAASAQDTRVLGKVVARDGSPIETAEVVLRSHARTFHPEFGDVHEVRTETGKNGRFRAKVFADRHYSAWARLPGEAPRFTEVLDGFARGDRLVLREEGFVRKPQRVVFQGIEAWKAHGPFRARCMSSDRNFLVRELELESDGASVRVPQLPGANTVIELVDARGEVLMFKRYSNSYRAADAKLEEAEHVTACKLVAPRRIRIRLEAYEDKTLPIVGARIHWELGQSHAHDRPMEANTKRSVLRDVGATNEKGVVEADVPVSQQWSWGHFIVHPTGRVLTAVDLNPRGTKSFTKKLETDDKSISLVARIKRGPELTGRVLDAEGKGIGGLTLLFPQPCAIWFEKTSSNWRTLEPRAYQTDAEGRFRLGALMPGQTMDLIALPSAALAARVAPKVDPKLRHLRRIVLTSHTTSKDAKRAALGDLRADVRTLPVEVKLRGNFVRYARVSALPRSRGGRSEALDQVVCDRRGRASLLISSQVDEIVAWHPERGYAILKFNKSMLSDVTEDLTIELKAYRWASGRITDSKGRGLEGATLRSWGTTTRGRVRRSAIKINQALREAVKSDADGNFRFPFIPEPKFSVRLRANYQRNGQNRGSESNVECTYVDANVEDLELTIKTTPRGTKTKSRAKKRSD